MSMARLKNSVSRNGFDLSRFNKFTAREGGLYPVFKLEQFPSDHFEIDFKWRTNTTPMKTASYVTIKENLDVFFVPYHLLFGDFEQWKSQADIDNYASSPTQGSLITSSDAQPWCTSDEIYEALSNFNGEASSDFPDFNVRCANEIAEPYRRVPDMFVLMNMLDYGTFSSVWNLVGHDNPSDGLKYTYEPSYEGGSFSSYWNSGVANCLPQFMKKPLNLYFLAAYQKIYQDFYRRTQWEGPSPWSYNFDYMRSIGGDTPTHFDVNAIFSAVVQEDSFVPTLFDFHYANYGDDLFMGLLPRPQYGPSSVVPVDAVGTFVDLDNKYSSTSTDHEKPLGEGKTVDGGLSILALRQGEALQKWREVTQSNDMDYRSQVEAHYGIKLPACSSHMCRWLGGTSNYIQISPNLANTADAQAEVRGNGYSDNGHLHVSCSTKQMGTGDGIIMAIYSVYPLLDYSSRRLPRENQRHYATDYPVPEFDKIGMEPVYLSELFCPRYLASNGSLITSGVAPMNLADTPIGYAPRYYDLKTSVDTVHSGMLSDFRDWTCYRPDGFDGVDVSIRGSVSEIKLDYGFFKVRPKYADSIFYSTADGYDPEDMSPYESDHYLVEMFIKVSASRPYDRNGLPY